jgi:hypothetical protein
MMRRALVKPQGMPIVECRSLPLAKRRSESDIVVQVRAAGVNALDRTMVSRGYGSELLDLLRGSEYVLGQEFSGVCTAVGRNVMDVRVGDEVYGAVDPWSRCGTLTEELVVNEADVALKPRGWTHERAATLPFAVMTVWRDVVEHALKKRAKSALVFGARGKVGGVAAALLRELVPSMRRVESVGREGFDSEDRFDIVVDAASSQGAPLDLDRFVAPSGLYCSFNGPWLTLTGRRGLVVGTFEAGQRLLEKKAQGWTRNGSSFKWGVMRGSGSRALNQVARAIENGALAELGTRPVHVVESLEEAERQWDALPANSVVTVTPSGVPP